MDVVQAALNQPGPSAAPAQSYPPDPGPAIPKVLAEAASDMMDMDEFALPYSEEMVNLRSWYHRRQPQCAHSCFHCTQPSQPSHHVDKGKVREALMM